MSEVNQNPAKTKNTLTKVFIVLVIVAIPLFICGIGYIAIPTSIRSNYKNRNCDSVLSLNQVYKSIYPAIIRDLSLSTAINECELYAQAASNEQKGNWQAAYDAYQIYSNTYPSGLYAKESYEHSAIMLMNMAKDQTEQKSYDKALANLNLIVSKYRDANVAAEAWTLFPKTYIDWGTGLRDSTEFEKAEQVFNEFKTWGQNNQKTDSATTAQGELAKTYLAWGLALQSQKQFESALTKFDMAASADAQSQLLAKADQGKLYVDWGNDLLGQSEFPGAIEKFEQAVAKSDNSAESAKDGLANGYIQWATSLSKGEDFEAALKQLEIAKQTASSEAMKKSVDSAFEDMYLAFSNSNGTQAQHAMRAALVAICDKHKKPDLPIFGLNKDVIRFGIYGVDAKLPENLAAQTPGEMHYVACVEEGNKIVETRSQKQIILRTSRGYYYIIVQQFRAELLWNMRLLATDTLQSAGQMSFTGGTPPPFPSTGEGTYFDGPPPDMADVAQWLLSITNT